MFRHFEVGQLFEPGKTQYNESVKFDFTQNGPSLYLFFDRPTEKEIQATKTGQFKIGFYEYDTVIFILAKFTGLNWVDAPYSVHLSQPFEFAPELEQENLGFGLQIYLIDAATGILKVMRYIGLGHDFSIRLREAILKQKSAPFDEILYDAKINEAYQRYTTNDLVSYAECFFQLN